MQAGEAGEVPPGADQQIPPQPQPSPSFASHALRNPSVPVIQPVKKKKKPTDGHSASVAREILQEKREAFLDDLQAFQAAQQDMISKLAEKHSRKPEYMEAILTQRSLYKKERAPNLQNAKVFRKAKELNEDRDPGEKLNLARLQEAVRADPALQNMSAKEEEDLINEYKEARAVKKAGARINNQAANLDYQSTVTRVESEINLLAKRTGVSAIAFFSRSHVNDSVEPYWASTPGALQFLPEALQTSSGEFGRKFELWSVTKGERSGNELVKLQSECVEMIIHGLRYIVKRRDVLMSYRYYDTDIRARWKVELRGWPSSVRFVAPGNISIMHEIRTLHGALSSGECKWVQMSPAQVGELANQLKETPVVKTRKPRKRKTNENTDPNNEAETSTAGRKRRRVTAKSRAMVEGDGET